MKEIKYRSIKKYKYQLLDTYRHKTGLHIAKGVSSKNNWIKLQTGWLTIKRGYAWDGPSGPTIDTKNFMRGSLVHDALYQLMREGKVNRERRKEADELLRDICIEDGMSKMRAWYVYQSVRVFGGKSVK